MTKGRWVLPTTTSKSLHYQYALTEPGYVTLCGLSTAWYTDYEGASSASKCKTCLRVARSRGLDIATEALDTLSFAEALDTMSFAEAVKAAIEGKDLYRPDLAECHTLEYKGGKLYVVLMDDILYDEFRDIDEDDEQAQWAVKEYRQSWKSVTFAEAMQYYSQGFIVRPEGAEGYELKIRPDAVNLSWEVWK